MIFSRIGLSCKVYFRGQKLNKYDLNHDKEFVQFYNDLLKELDLENHCNSKSYGVKWTSAPA